MGEAERDIEPSLNCHQKTGLSSKFFSCLPCNLRFSTVSALKIHVGNVHKVNSSHYICTPPCDKTFETLTKFYTHCRYFHADKRLRCDQCQKSFKRIDKLKLHVQSHNKDMRGFMCLCCLATFRRSDKLNAHLKKRHNTVPLPPRRRRRSEKNSQRCSGTPAPRIQKKEKNKTKPPPSSSSSKSVHERIPQLIPSTNKVNEFCQSLNVNESTGVLIEPGIGVNCESFMDDDITEMSQEEFNSLLASNTFSVVFDGKDTVYSCHLCFSKFKRHGMFTSHMYNNHPTVEMPPLTDEYVPRKTRSVYQCPFCKATTPTSIRLQNHVRRYHEGYVLDPKFDKLKIQIPLESVPEKCQYCHCSYLNNWKLKEHIRQKHPDEIQSNSSSESRKRVEFWRRTFDCDLKTVEHNLDSLFDVHNNDNNYANVNLHIENQNNRVILVQEPDEDDLCLAPVDIGSSRVRPSSTPAVVDNDQYFPLSSNSVDMMGTFPMNVNFNPNLASTAPTMDNPFRIVSTPLHLGNFSLFDEESTETLQRPFTPVTPLPVAVNHNNAKLVTPKVPPPRSKTPEHGYTILFPSNTEGTFY